MESDNSLRQMAEEIFSLMLVSWRERLAQRGGSGAELSESQFLTLDVVVRAKEKVLTVGEIQRTMGFMPAQMSRMIRSLEAEFDKPLINCQINPMDKRKIDVTLTAEGSRVYEEFRNVRLNKTVETLRGLAEADRRDFVRVCGRIRELYQGGSS